MRWKSNGETDNLYTTYWISKHHKNTYRKSYITGSLANIYSYDNN